MCSSPRGTVIHLDTSALVELVVREAESATLLAWLQSRSDVPLVTSALGPELVSVVVYDRRLADACRAVELPWDAPGQE